MSYQRMTVAELKAICTDQGIELMGDERKADIIGLLERYGDPAGDDGAVAVEAEVIEEGGAIERIAYTPAIIDAASYLDAKREWLRVRMEPYEGMDDAAIAAMDVRAAKACRADINRAIGEVEEERKAIKRAYKEPLDRFEEAVRDLLEPARRCQDQLKGYIDDQARKAAELRRQGLRLTYEDFAPALAPVVPFERILEINPKWMNASYDAGKAAHELEDAVSGIARDWAALQAQRASMRFYEESEAVFFRTLDLGAAIGHNAMREEEQARIEAMRAEVEGNRAAQQMPEPMPEPADPIDPATGECIGPCDQPDPEPAPEPAQGPIPEPQARLPYVIRIDLTEGEKVRLMAFIRDNGIGERRWIGVRRDG